jgi:nitric oxide reductase NorD protein
MSEPEDVILEGAHIATTFARDLWRRHAPQPQLVGLDELRLRLELFVEALYGTALPIAVAEPPALPSWLARLARPSPRHLDDRRAHPATDGVRIRLPKTLDTPGERQAVLSHFRLLAIQQAARASRGTARYAPAEHDLLLRDLFLLAEAVAIDQTLASELPGLLADLRAGRAAALAARPAPDLLTPCERVLEAWICAALQAHPADVHAAIPRSATPSESLAWAQASASAVRQAGGAYRGLPLVALWGRVLPVPAGEPTVLAPFDEQQAGSPPTRFRVMRRRPRVREAQEDEDDSKPGAWMVRIDAPEESVEDPRGLQRPTDRDDQYSPDDLADALAELPEARLVQSPGKPREVLASEDPPERRAVLQHGARTATGVIYPEWDYRANVYRPHGATVRELAPPLGEPAWAERALAQHAQVVHQVRRQFESLRPRRLRLARQRDGDELDLDAYVTSYASVRAGQASDDRLYIMNRMARHELAIALLVDSSASTDSWVAGNQRIIDVEKLALLIVCEALDRLGNRYAIMAFSGEGPHNIALWPIKRFAEPNDTAVRQRIAGLGPDRYTRLGAAIRYTTALLARERAWHRLLLVLSDGKPNDVDLYEGRYGVEDTRQAIAEARMQGMHAFCVTVDRQAPAYITRIFGPGAYAILRQPERLPAVLIEVLRRLMRSA